MILFKHGRYCDSIMVVFPMVSIPSGSPTLQLISQMEGVEEESHKRANDNGWIGTDLGIRLFVCSADLDSDNVTGSAFSSQEMVHRSSRIPQPKLTSEVERDVPR